jgi:hypothetical protein
MDGLIGEMVAKLRDGWLDRDMSVYKSTVESRIAKHKHGRLSKRDGRVGREMGG